MLRLASSSRCFIGRLNDGLGLNQQEDHARGSMQDNSSAHEHDADELRDGRVADDDGLQVDDDDNSDVDKDGRDQEERPR